VLARQFDEMEDAYLRERKADVEQVVERLLRELTDAAGSAAERAAQAQPARDFAGKIRWCWWPAIWRRPT
jgi:phosphotransferase system enzyme I (PtsI)